MVTKLDVLDAVEKIPVCTGYKVDGRTIDTIPADVRGLESIKPILTTLKGWKAPTENLRTFEQLPAAARDYLKFLEKESGAKIGMISTGPDRDQTILLPEFAAALDGMSAGQSGS